MEPLKSQLFGRLYALSGDDVKKVCDHLGVLKEARSKFELIRYLIEYLELEEEKQADHAHLMYTAVDDFVAQLIQLDTVETVRPSSPPRQPEPSTKTSDQQSTFPHGNLFRREFKISGQLGEPGQRGTLSYDSLSRQIDSGLRQGYPENEIKEAVIRCISTSVQTRSYIEKVDDLSLSMLKELLKGLYEDSSATKLYQELCNLAQSPKEDPRSFLIRALDTRQRVLFASKETGTGIKYCQELVQEMLIHALRTGLYSDAIRQELQPLLLNPHVTDAELIRCMNQASMAELERSVRLKQKAKINQVDVPEQSHAASIDVKKQKS